DENDVPKEACPRCKANFASLPLVPIVIGQFTLGKFIQRTFFVEDKRSEKVVKTIAQQLGKKVVVDEAGNSENVKRIFRLARAQGNLENGYFLVDGDNKGTDEELKTESHFI